MKGARKLLAAVMAVAIAVTGALLLTGCGSKNGSKTITNLVYNGEAVTWTRVLKAKHYLVSIDGGETKEVAQSDAPTISYAFKTEGDFSFSIEAVVKEGSDKNPTLTQQFTNIGRVTGLKVDSGKLVWNVVEAADGYELMENGTVLAQPVGVNEYPLKAGSFQYKVRAIKGRETAVDGNNGYYSLWSETFTGKVLEAPKNLKYDSETFTWEKVNKATGYVIKIGNEEFNTTEPKYDFVAGKDDFEVSVKAVGDEADNCYDSAFSEQKTYTYLERITSLNVTEGILVWDAVENAAGYKIRVDGMLQNDVLPDNKYDRLVSEHSYQISVLPIGSSDFYFSQWSPVATINVIPSPTISFEGNAIKWTSVANAGGYKLEIMKDDVVVASPTAESNTVVYSGYDFAEVGKYTVRVKATAQPQSGWYESRYSAAFPVRRLAAPSELTVTNRPEEAAQVALSFSSVVGANGYTLKINDTDYNTKNSGTTFEVDITGMTDLANQSQIKFSVFANGKTTDQEAILPSASGAEVTVTKLATPQNFSINGSTLAWDTVTGVESYIVSIDGTRHATATAKFTLPSMSAGPHTIYVQAAGNRANVICSNYSTALNVNKLAQPTNLSVDANGILTWTSPSDGITNYIVRFGDTDYDRSVNNFDLKGYTDRMAAGVLTQLTVRSKGNGSTTLDSEQSKTAGIYKYTAPTGLALNGTNLVWNQPEYNGAKCNSYELTITPSQGEAIVRKQSGNSFSLSELAAGKYTAKLRALGDKQSTWDSELSTAFTFTKLETVSGLTREGNEYRWNPVAGATGYTVKYGTTVAAPTTKTSFTVPFDKAGTYSLEITAIGNATDIVNAEPLQFEQKVEALKQPVKDTDFTVSRVDNSLSITIIGNYANATGYEFIIGGTTSGKVQNKTFTRALDNSAEVTVQVKICGGQFGADGTYYIDSNTSTVTKA